MKKIIKYYKPFTGFIILAVLLLLLQAICDLKLPDYMADIVNVGIQSNGIEEVAPKAISSNGLSIMKKFMDENEKELVDNSYEKVLTGDTNYINKYSLVKQEDIFILKDNLKKETQNELDSAFEISSQTFITLIKDFSQNNKQTIDNKGSNNNMNLEELYKAMPMINKIPQDKIESARATASAQPEDIAKNIAKVFTKAFYSELGVDLSKIQSNYIIIIGAKMIGITFVGIVASIIVGFLASKTAAGLSRNLRREIFEKVENFSITEFNKFSEASLITRTTNDVTQLQNVTVMGIRMLTYAPIMGIGALLMMISRTTEMTWTILLGCVAILIPITIMFKIVMPKIKIIQDLTDKLNLVSKENLSGLMVIRAFGTDKHEEKRFAKVNSESAKVNRFVNRAAGFMMPTMMLIMNLLILLIIWVGGHQIAESTIQVGDLMAIIQYAMQVIMSFLMISIVFVMFPRASVSADRIAEVLETDTTIKDPEFPKEFDNNKKGYIEFKNVSFQYENAEELVLENINFVAKPGETTAFIGATGSGKSTLINLIPRFYDVTKGEVLVNGVNVKELKLSDLHSQIGYVPQKANLLSGTIKSNIMYGNKDASEDLIKQNAEIAQAAEFIESKEDKFESEIAQGAKNVSGGQKQRLSIARALTVDAPILIFDDSFSALDFTTDKKLRAALKEQMENKNILIIAQRVNTIMNADQIIVLDNGKIVGKGTHEELVKNCKTYYEIVSSQLTEDEMKLDE